MKNKKKIISIIITITVVGLLSLIPYFITKNNEKVEKVTKDSSFKLSNLKYDIPEGFEKHNNYIDEDYNYYTYSEDDSYCHIELFKLKNYSNLYKDGEDYIRKNSYFTLNDEVETETVNGWFTIIIKNQDKGRIEKTTAYLYDNSIYVLDYNFTDYSHGETSEEKSYIKCATAYDYVFKSIKIEK